MNLVCYRSVLTDGPTEDLFMELYMDALMASHWVVDGSLPLVGPNLMTGP
jgi:hypothetical protein